jgi:hypothetical protein
MVFLDTVDDATSAGFPTEPPVPPVVDADMPPLATPPVVEVQIECEGVDEPEPESSPPSTTESNDGGDDDGGVEEEEEEEEEGNVGGDDTNPSDNTFMNDDDDPDPEPDAEDIAFINVASASTDVRAEFAAAASTDNIIPDEETVDDSGLRRGTRKRKARVLWTHPDEDRLMAKLRRDHDEDVAAGIIGPESDDDDDVEEDDDRDVSDGSGSGADGGEKDSDGSWTEDEDDKHDSEDDEDSSSIDSEIPEAHLVLFCDNGGKLFEFQALDDDGVTVATSEDHIDMDDKTYAVAEVIGDDTTFVCLTRDDAKHFHDRMMVFAKEADTAEATWTFDVLSGAYTVAPTDPICTDVVFAEAVEVFFMCVAAVSGGDDATV